MYVCIHLAQVICCLILFEYLFVFIFVIVFFVHFIHLTVSFGIRFFKTMQAKNWRFFRVFAVNLMNFPIRISSFNKNWFVAFSHGDGIVCTCCHDQLMTLIQSFAWLKIITFQYSPAAYQIVTEWLKFLMKFKTLHSEYQLIEHICMYICVAYICINVYAGMRIYTHTHTHIHIYQFQGIHMIYTHVRT